MNDESDLKYFLVSLALHLSLFLVFAVKVVLFPGERLETLKAVRVDFVALPDKNPQIAPQGEEKTPPPQNTAEKKEKTTNEKMVAPPEKSTSEKNKKPSPEVAKTKESTKPSKDEKIKEQQSAALQRLEALSKIKKMKKIHDDIPEGTTVKGNQLSEGNSLTGVEKIEYNRYLSDLDLHIKKNWHLPEWLANKPLTTAVLVRFNEQGQLLEKRMLRSSGNSEFDKAAMDAVATSAPFPPPPENLASYFQSRGIELRFPE